MNSKPYLKLIAALLAVGLPMAGHSALGPLKVKSSLDEEFSGVIAATGEEAALLRSNPGAARIVGEDLDVHTVAGRRGQVYLKVTSNKRIKDPILRFGVELGSLRQDYAVLVDMAKLGARATSSSRVESSQRTAIAPPPPAPALLPPAPAPDRPAVHSVIVERVEVVIRDPFVPLDDLPLALEDSARKKVVKNKKKMSRAIAQGESRALRGPAKGRLAILRSISKERLDFERARLAEINRDLRDMRRQLGASDPAVRELSASLRRARKELNRQYGSLGKMRGSFAKALEMEVENQIALKRLTGELEVLGASSAAGFQGVGLVAGASRERLDKTALRLAEIKESGVVGDRVRRENLSKMVRDDVPIEDRYEAIREEARQRVEMETARKKAERELNRQYRAARRVARGFDGAVMDEVQNQMKLDELMADLESVHQQRNANKLSEGYESAWSDYVAKREGLLAERAAAKETAPAPSGGERSEMLARLDQEIRAREERDAKDRETINRGLAEIRELVEKQVAAEQSARSELDGKIANVMAELGSKSDAGNLGVGLRVTAGGSRGAAVASNREELELMRSMSRDRLAEAAETIDEVKAQLKVADKVRRSNLSRMVTMGVPVEDRHVALGQDQTQRRAQREALAAAEGELRKQRAALKSFLGDPKAALERETRNQIALGGALDALVRASDARNANILSEGFAQAWANDPERSRLERAKQDRLAAGVGASGADDAEAIRKRQLISGSMKEMRTILEAQHKLKEDTNAEVRAKIDAMVSELDREVPDEDARARALRDAESEARALYERLGGTDAGRPAAATTPPAAGDDGEKARLQAQREAELRAERESRRLEAERETARLKQENEAARLKAEREAERMKAELEAAKRKAQEEADRLKAAQEDARLKLEEERERLKAAQEEARRKIEEEQARLKAEREAERAKAEQEAMRLASEREAKAEAERLAEAERIKAETERKKAEVERKKAEAEREVERLKAERDAAVKVRTEQEAAKLELEKEAERLKAEQEAARQAELERKAEEAKRQLDGQAAQEAEQPAPVVPPVDAKPAPDAGQADLSAQGEAEPASEAVDQEQIDKQIAGQRVDSETKEPEKQAPAAERPQEGGVEFNVQRADEALADPETGGSLLLLIGKILLGPILLILIIVVAIMRWRSRKASPGKDAPKKDEPLVQTGAAQERAEASEEIVAGAAEASEEAASAEQFRQPDVSMGQPDMGMGQADMGMGQTDMGMGQTDMGAGQTDMGMGGQAFQAGFDSTSYEGSDGVYQGEVGTNPQDADLSVDLGSVGSMDSGGLDVSGEFTSDGGFGSSGDGMDFGMGAPGADGGMDVDLGGSMGGTGAGDGGLDFDMGSSSTSGGGFDMNLDMDMSSGDGMESGGSADLDFGMDLDEEIPSAPKVMAMPKDTGAAEEAPADFVDFSSPDAASGQQDSGLMDFDVSDSDAPQSDGFDVDSLGLEGDSSAGGGDAFDFDAGPVSQDSDTLGEPSIDDLNQAFEDAAVSRRKKSVEDQLQESEKQQLDFDSSLDFSMFGGDSGGLDALGFAEQGTGSQDAGPDLSAGGESIDTGMDFSTGGESVDTGMDFSTGGESVDTGMDFSTGGESVDTGMDFSTGGESVDTGMDFSAGADDAQAATDESLDFGVFDEAPSMEPVSSASGEDDSGGLDFSSFGEMEAESPASAPALEPVASAPQEEPSAGFEPGALEEEPEAASARKSIFTHTEGVDIGRFTADVANIDFSVPLSIKLQLADLYSEQNDSNAALEALYDVLDVSEPGSNLYNEARARIDRLETV